MAADSGGGPRRESSGSTQQANSAFTTQDQLTSRPLFVESDKLRDLHACSLCNDVLLQPQQTVCGHRVCKTCIDQCFDGRERIACPIQHDSESGEDEPCQEAGLRYSQLVPDVNSHKSLLRQPCYCVNQPYGCSETPRWKELQTHQEACQFNLVDCPNMDCSQEVSEVYLQQHLDVCGQAIIACNYCNQPFKRQELEGHIRDCDVAEEECEKCGKYFTSRKLLKIHVRTRPECLIAAGRCYYYSYCQVEKPTIPELAAHMRDDLEMHLEIINIRAQSLQEVVSGMGNMTERSITKTVKAKINPLERAAAVVYKTVNQVEEKLSKLDDCKKPVTDALAKIKEGGRQLTMLQKRISKMEKALSTAGIDRIGVVDSHSEALRTQNQMLGEMQDKLKVAVAEQNCNNGTLLWKIDDYQRKKHDIKRGRQTFVQSPEICTSTYGYRFSAKAYLNGDASGRGSHLSLFINMLRGPYDPLLKFPFTREITFALICPGNPARNVIQSLKPSPFDTAFRRPVADRNFATGYPKFADQALVESTDFCVGGSIYIKIVIAPGDDIID